MVVGSDGSAQRAFQASSELAPLDLLGALSLAAHRVLSPRAARPVRSWTDLQNWVAADAREAQSFSGLAPPPPTTGVVHNDAQSVSELDQAQPGRFLAPATTSNLHVLDPETRVTSGLDAHTESHHHGWAADSPSSQLREAILKLCVYVCSKRPFIVFLIVVCRRVEAREAQVRARKAEQQADQMERRLLAFAVAQSMIVGASEPRLASLLTM